MRQHALGSARIELQAMGVAHRAVLLIRGTSMLIPPGSGWWQSPQPSPSWFRSWRACWSTRQPCSVSDGTFFELLEVGHARDLAGPRHVDRVETRGRNVLRKPGRSQCHPLHLPLPGSVTTVGPELWVRAAEIGGVEERGQRRLHAQIAMAVRAQALRYGDDPGQAPVLAVAAGAGGRREAREGEARDLEMMPRTRVARCARLAAHRDEGQLVAGLAVVAQQLVRRRQRAAQPEAIEADGKGAALLLARALRLSRPVSQDRQRQTAGDDEEEQQPGDGALAEKARAETYPSLRNQLLDRIGRRRRDEFDRQRQIGVPLVLAELQAIGPDLDLEVRCDSPRSTGRWSIRRMLWPTASSTIPSS